MYRRDQRELPRARSVYASPIALAQFKYVPSPPSFHPHLLPSPPLLTPSLSTLQSLLPSLSNCASSLSHVIERLIGRALPPLNPQGEAMVAPR